MASTQPTPHRWAYADLFSLPDDGKRYEIIDEALYEMPAPNIDHARVIINLLAVLIPLVQSLGGRGFTAPLDVFFPGADPVQPDLLVLLPEQVSLMSKRGIEGAPALIVEVLSPSNPEHDRIVKRALYARAGVVEYWLVSPEAAIVEVLTLAGSHYQTHARVAGDESLSLLVLPGLDCTAARIFQ
jgi:Uma2 family endonuclease